MPSSVARTALAMLGLLAAFGASVPATLSAQPTVDSVKIVSSAGSDNTYTRGDTIKVRVYFNYTTSHSGSVARLTLNIGSATGTARNGGTGY